jgi:hypothetical protein
MITSKSFSCLEYFWDIGGNFNGVSSFRGLMIYFCFNFVQRYGTYLTDTCWDYY